MLGWTAREGDLEREGDERVEEGEEEVCCHSCDPAPDDELVEVQRALPLDKLHVDWEVEWEGEERYNNQIDQSNHDCGDRNRRVEGSKVEC